MHNIYYYRQKNNKIEFILHFFCKILLILEYDMTILHHR